MAYTPTEWVTGDLITAEKLNKAEQGIEANSKLVYVSKWEFVNGQPSLVSGNYQDALEVAEAGGIVVISMTSDVGIDNYVSTLVDENGKICFVAFSTSADTIRINGAAWTSNGLEAWPNNA